METLTVERVKKIVGSFSDNEAMEQYGNHRDFLLGGLDGKEEWKSRIAFADTYRDELEEIHNKLKEEFQIQPGENEFAYLKDRNFREGADKESSRIIDLMKDYMAYRFYTDKENNPDKITKVKIDEIYDDNNPFDSKEEKDYRRLIIPKKEMDFLIEKSAYSEEKKQGIRECRKWMYRNCSKAGAFKMAGTKRNYIDSFGKMPVQQQVNALHQVESGYYKYEDKDGIGETEAASDAYVPNLGNLKNRMVRSKWQFYTRPTGGHTIWSRLERAVDKTVERADEINGKYAAYKEDVNKNEGKNSTLEEREASVNQKVFQKKAEATIEKFDKLSKEYHEALRTYLENRKKKNEDALKRKGLEIQNLWKDKNNQEILKKVEGDTKAYTEFIELTKKLEDINRMTDNDISRINPEVVIAKIDKYVGWKNLGATAWGIGTGIAGAFGAKSAVTDTISSGFSVLGWITGTYTAVKSGVMSWVSGKRRDKAIQAKAMLKDEYKSYNEADTAKHGKDNKKANILAKVSKRANMGRKRTYLSTALFAGAAVAFGIASVAAATVAMPITITGTVVSIGGTIFNAYYSSRRNTKLLKKAADSSAKLDEDYKTLTDDDGNKVKRYIEVKTDKRKKILENKIKRFKKGSSSYDILDTYIKKPKYIKERLRTAYAVKKGGCTLNSFKARLDKELVEEAYRHIFLIDPDGPITEENLIKKEDFNKIVSARVEDRESDEVKAKMGKEQSLHEARIRVEYKELLEAEGVKIKVPENVNEAKRMFHEKNRENNGPAKN